MEKLCKRLAVRVCEAIEGDREKRDVVEYGLIAIFQFLIILVLSSIIGIVFKFFIETLIMFFSVIFLRKAIGGAHSKGFNSCLVISISCICILSWLSKYIIAKYISFIIICIAIAIIYIMAYVLIYKLAPVDNPNKRITNANKIKRLRKQSFVLAGIYTFIELLLLISYHYNYTYCLSYAVCLSLSVLWQVLMLTELGHKLINKIDNLLGI